MVFYSVFGAVFVSFFLSLFVSKSFTITLNQSIFCVVIVGNKLSSRSIECSAIFLFWIWLAWHCNFSKWKIFPCSPKLFSFPHLFIHLTWTILHLSKCTEPSSLKFGKYLCVHRYVLLGVLLGCASLLPVSVANSNFLNLRKSIILHSFFSFLHFCPHSFLLANLE